ncbi:MAG: ferritin-like domain-containing protein [Nibricoccus sp.]
MPSLENLHELFVEEIRDLYDAELQLSEALPLMAKAATSSQLKKGFTAHKKETEEHVHRLEKIFDGLGIPPAGKICRAMRGLIAETREVINEDTDPEVLDAALIVAAQKIEHYEIAGYGSMRAFARLLNYKDAIRILESTLKEEVATDEKLTQLSEQLNPKAEAADLAERD